MKPIALIPLALVLIGCFGKDIVTNPEENTPAACSGSTLCRLENPADTSLLTSEQKDAALNNLQFRPDSTKFGIVFIDIKDLRKDTIRIKLFADRQPLAISSSISFSNDSLRAVWNGTVQGAVESRVMLMFVGGAFYSGWVETDSVHHELIALGGNAIMVIAIPIVHPDECSPAMKPAASRLTCSPLP